MEKTDKTAAQIEQEAIEGNEIIASWLGWIRCEPGEYNLPNWWEPDPKDGRKKGTFRGYPHQLKFHSSWSWLMPVVEKIGKVKGYQVSIFTGNGNGGCQIQDTNSIANKKVPPLLLIVHADLRPISAVYQSVVEFIKWHNSQDASNQPKKQ